MRKLQSGILIAGLFLLTLAMITTVQAQTGSYPDKPVTIISDSAPGSTPDVNLRFVADAFRKMWGQQVVVINHPGANGSVATRAASDAAPDGYTLYHPVLCRPRACG
jgi:tripartite-type tricarboxylate transporter receptor subunit TctC